MTIENKAGNIHKHADCLSRWALNNTPENTAYVPASAEPQIPIEGIKITDVGTELFGEVIESYNKDNNCNLLNTQLGKDCKDAALADSLDDILKKSYDNRRLHLFDECHDNIYSGNLSEDRKMERIKTCAWWQAWRKDVIEHFHSCERCQKDIKASGKIFGLMINIQEPITPWEVVHMDWPCHKDDTAMYTAILVWKRVISHTGLFKNIISDRDPKFTLVLWTNLHKIFGKKLSFSTGYHPPTDGLAERIIQTLEDMIRRFCAYGLEFRDSYSFSHDWCILIPALELAYKTSIHASKGKNPAMLEKGWNPKLPVDTLKKDLVDINPTASSFKIFLDKSHKTPEFKVGDLILVSNLRFNDIKGPKKLKDSLSGPCIIKGLHGTNAVQVQLSGELENKNTAFPVSLVKHPTTSDKELFPLRNETPLEVPPLDPSAGKKVLKVLKESRIGGKNEREYLVRYKNPQHEDK
ncbi:hypothetical protein O181_088138 [Austropuccinia psidii MF-1]|uniref:Integrase catalytic domain-containing protein n=1 Tax=Austropuccinia psidii MF-1 TaxID=1389203 RepID=A0A9Q3IR01_9BASI|nr:hypothetical protein [Austropuccinia psidii MF-1]